MPDSPQSLQAPPEVALLDYPSAQRYLGGVSRSTLKTLIGRGELAVVRIRRRTLFRRVDLDAFVSRRFRGRSRMRSPTALIRAKARLGMRFE